MDNHHLKAPIKKATFAMGCFWGPDSLFGATKGVMRTKVGYCGGKFENPTYHNIGDHTESIDIEYNPREVTYNTLIHLFWDNHNPFDHTITQYTSIIFYHDHEQKAIAESTMKDQSKRMLGNNISTKIVPFKVFYDAEDYHQKYRLQQYASLMEAVGLKRGSDLKSSLIAARLNGYVVGLGGIQQFDGEVSLLGLDDETANYVRQLIIKYKDQGMLC